MIIKKKKPSITQKIIRLSEESAHCPVLFHIINLNENIKLLLVKLGVERKLISHFNPAVRNVSD